jgi:hypothetical protein
MYLMPRHKQFPIDLGLVIFVTLLCLPFVLVRSALKRNFAGKDYLGFAIGALSTRLRVNRYFIPAEGRFRWDRTNSAQLWTEHCYYVLIRYSIELHTVKTLLRKAFMERRSHIARFIYGLMLKDKDNLMRGGLLLEKKEVGWLLEVIDIQSIREKMEKGKYRISFTHTEKLRERKIGIAELEEAISIGEVIEAYLDDPRGPSCLILGFTHQGRSLHIVCGDLEAERILVITAYEPSLEAWEEDWKTRR